ncbi:hypothetical protein NDU88_004034 [Pleurodeles waltl]|uniref:Uncharacterized protein n=1 Tax=Pleurodeles waltl TaxID=8319 RepID=A0AAV7RKB8_PLEWA|nr:hypothetical protein NDU88_004034 [Pleurodeles waltl]
MPVKARPAEEATVRATGFLVNSARERSHAADDTQEEEGRTREVPAVSVRKHQILKGMKITATAAVKEIQVIVQMYNVHATTWEIECFFKQELCESVRQYVTNEKVYCILTKQEALSRKCSPSCTPKVSGATHPVKQSSTVAEHNEYRK